MGGGVSGAAAHPHLCLVVCAGDALWYFFYPSSISYAWSCGCVLTVGVAASWQVIVGLRLGAGGNMVGSNLSVHQLVRPGLVMLPLPWPHPLGGEGFLSNGCGNESVELCGWK